MGKSAYYVVVHGENLWLLIDERPRRAGFYAGRYVSAADEQRAGELAIKIVRKDVDDMHPLNTSEQEVRYGIHHIDRVDAVLKQTGFTFYNPELEQS
jgi:hypothetical protein